MKSYSILPANICFFKIHVDIIKLYSSIQKYSHFTQLNVSGVPLQNISLDTPLTFRVKPL